MYGKLSKSVVRSFTHPSLEKWEGWDSYPENRTGCCNLLVNENFISCDIFWRFVKVCRYLIPALAKTFFMLHVTILWQVISLSYEMKNFYVKARNIEKMHLFHVIRTLILSWTHVKRSPGGDSKENFELDTLSEWIKSISDVLERRIQRLKSIKIRHESIFNDPNVVRELIRLHESFVIVPADKVSNNCIFVCKKYCVVIPIEEPGLHLLPGNHTYNLKKFLHQRFLDNHKSIIIAFGIQTHDEELDLLYIFWIPKMQKYPYKHRFIAGSLKYWSKPLSILPTKLLKLLSKVFKSAAKQPTQEVGSTRCGYLRIQKNYKSILNHQFIANWLEGRTIKYTNFPAKYMNSRSKLHWNIHVVLCQVGVTWNKRRGIGIPELHDLAERHSAFNTSSKWISLIFYFYDIFLVFSPLMWCLQVYWH